jgi:hypothetical protein
MTPHKALFRTSQHLLHALAREKNELAAVEGLISLDKLVFKHIGSPARLSFGCERGAAHNFSLCVAGPSDILLDNCLALEFISYAYWRCSRYYPYAPHRPSRINSMILS